MNATATAATETSQALLAVDDLEVEFSRGRRRPPLRAVDGVSLQIAQGETVGLVGESGSGKTTIGRAILGLSPISGGRVTFAGTEITHANQRQRRALSADLQVVFQDPYNSLNPARTIGQTLGETLRAQGATDRDGIDERVREMLERVGLPRDAGSRYPVHFSGGQRQRIAIARALMASPRLVVCDEPVSALDVSVQASVLNLLRQLQRDLDLAYLFIAHDLPVVRYLSHRIIVLYRGRIMEEGPAETVHNRPLHPYTRALLDAAPLPDPEQQAARRAARTRLKLQRATSVAQETGCPFAPRCPHAIDLCRSERPKAERADRGTAVACHRWRELAGPSGNGAGGVHSVNDATLL
jgi:peptide/nickel transport system ATP-binding protein